MSSSDVGGIATETDQEPNIESDVAMKDALAFIMLGLVVLVAVIGIILLAGTDKEIPDSLNMIATGALGGLAGTALPGMGKRG